MDFAEFQSRHRESLEAIARRREQWLGSLAPRDQALEIGALLMLAAQEGPPLHWVAVMSNPAETRLWYFLPADLRPHAGPEDVATSSDPSDIGLMVHCGQGVWLLEDDLDLRLRVGRLPPPIVAQIQEKLRVLAVSPGDDTAEAEGDHPGEEDFQWMEAIRVAIASLRRRALSCDDQSRRLIVVCRSEFASDWSNLFPASDTTLHVLAAEGGLFAQLGGRDESAQDPDLRAAPIAYDGGGRLMIVRVAKHLVSFLYFPAPGNESPPPIYQIAPQGELVALNWHHNPHGIAACAVEPFRGSGTPAFRLGSDSGPLIVIEP